MSPGQHIFIRSVSLLLLFRQILKTRCQPGDSEIGYLAGRGWWWGLGGVTHQLVRFVRSPDRQYGKQPHTQQQDRRNLITTISQPSTAIRCLLKLIHYSGICVLDLLTMQMDNILIECDCHPTENYPSASLTRSPHFRFRYANLARSPNVWCWLLMGLEESCAKLYIYNLRIKLNK